MSLRRNSSKSGILNRKLHTRSSSKSSNNESVKLKSQSFGNTLEKVNESVSDLIDYREKLDYLFFHNIVEYFIRDYKTADNVQCSCSLPNETITEDFAPPLKKNDSELSYFQSASLKPTPDWDIPTRSEMATTVYTNGNIYSGHTSKRVMDRWGTFRWSDGTIYTGEFENGCLTGNGTMRLPDLSKYKGHFCNGFFHGFGTLSVANSTMFYKGEWKFGKGWLYYNSNNWYDGEWFEDKKHGFGQRQYPDGTKYKGDYLDDSRNGQGTMVFPNNDFYRGEWRNDLMHGYGEYFWNCHTVKKLVFTPTNYYKGNWVEGKRTGVGLMNFGNESGAKLYGTWMNNLKHGPGVILCGNGLILHSNPLFEYDQPVHKMAIIRSQQSIHIPLDPFVFRRISQQLNAKMSMITFDEDILDCITRNSKLIAKNQFLFVAKRKSLTTNLCPLKISINPKITELNLNYLIEFVLKKCSLLNDEMIKNEENRIQNLIFLHLPKLMHIYETYATLAAQNFQGKAIMIRYFLWQLYRDLKFPQNGISLIQTDLNLWENPVCCLETPHNPFEDIYFWQFLLSIITNSVHLFLLEKSLENLDKTGILAQIFRNFLNSELYNLPLEFGENAINLHKNVPPLNCFYSLYLEIGEPHSVRQFICKCCTKLGVEPLCIYKSVIIKNNTTVKYFPFVIGNNLSFTQESLINPCPEETTESSDSFCKSLYIFRNLGKRKLFKCITNVCPYIKIDDCITNMDYSLSFIEFYEIILLCARELAELQIRKDE